ncbi:Alpha-2-macroglobulin-like protein 1 [Chionoecetes opilio]|uniref:Alpha-2-macroglobulin-like protein 1 n=1 Tax=Chionoecetes opilio TaxID=41210 RepID=A0A8J4YFN9_CHIOP|nr:Alpha-2-macroglobulin-like protein 1 [Chionoecetes opilio]
MVMPKVTTDSTNLHLKGSVNGLKVNDTVGISLSTDIEKTFVQTDKYLYRPGEKVQFRVLTVTGNKMQVSTAEYPEVWVNTPSRTRIAQWKNVSNTEGLVHLDFQLADETEEVGECASARVGECYTYGQPVKGNLSFTVHNNQNRKCHVSQTTNVTVSIVLDLLVTISICHLLEFTK